MSGEGGLPLVGRRWGRILGRATKWWEAPGEDRRGLGGVPLSRRKVVAGVLLALGVGGSLWFAWGSTTYTPAELVAVRPRSIFSSGTSLGPRSSAGADGAGAPVSRVELERERRRLQAALAAHRPRGAYIVVDRGNNRIFLRKGDSLLLEGVISTGSGAVLQETTGQKRQWVFDTPAGRFTILSERPDPVWTKPDWAFLEEGKPIPTRLSERREYGSLGEYALDLGDGYMIHGTLYERLLGRSVTHGCIRVGREDLRVLVRHTGPGSQVFIF